MDDQIGGEGRGWHGPVALSPVEKMWDKGGGLMPLGPSMSVSGSWDLG